MKAQSQRQLRAGELVRRAVSDIIREGHLHDPAIVSNSVTINEARTSPDLRHASVFISLLGGGNAEPAAAALNKAAGYLQRELGKQIELKFTPKLKFIADDRFDEATRIDSILDRDSVKRDLDEGGSR
jgi:ribosome-binding factor A